MAQTIVPYCPQDRRNEAPPAGTLGRSIHMIATDLHYQH
jgi:hypothetical protein